MAQVQIKKVEPEPETSRMKFVGIKVPPYVRDLAREVSRRTGKKIYVVVHDALSMYLNYLKKPYRKSELPKIDKVSWYALKLAASWGSFRENPTEQNAERLKEVAYQLMERLAIDTRELINLIEKWKNRRSKKLTADDKMEFNGAIKLIIASLIYYGLGDGEDNK